MADCYTYDEQFSCNCSDGETRVINADKVEHRCGFRPSASYGSLGVWTPYKRVKNITGRYYWTTDWLAKVEVTT